MSDTITTAPVKRNFNFNGLKLDDPDPSMPPEKVLEFHSLLRADTGRKRRTELQSGDQSWNRRLKK